MSDPKDKNAAGGDSWQPLKVKSLDKVEFEEIIHTKREDAEFSFLYSGSSGPAREESFHAMGEAKDTVDDAAPVEEIAEEPKVPEPPPGPDPAVIEKEAFDKGFNQGVEEGRVKGENDGRTTGETTGFEAGLKQAEEKVGRLEGILSQIETLWTDLVVTHETQLMELVCNIAGRVVQGVIETDHEVVRQTIRSALKDMPEPVTVHLFVSPQDYEFIEMVKDDFFNAAKSLKQVSVSADPGISRGSCRMESETGSLNANLEKRLQAITEEVVKAAIRSKPSGLKG